MLLTKLSSPKIANTDYIQAMRELRRSNAAGTHQDLRYRRVRTRLSAKTKEIKEQINGF